MSANSIDMQSYTPALGRAEFTSDYDRVIAVMTREHKWRSQLVNEINPQDDDVIVDIGSGTGTLAIWLKQRQPDCTIYAIDPDPAVRVLAEAKAKQWNTTIEFVTAMGEETVDEVPYGSVDTTAISLVLHQCSDEVKTSILANAFVMLRPSGRLYVADYGLQPDLMMQLLFNQVRHLDGYDHTRANKNGGIPVMIKAAGFADVMERAVTRTPTGAITIWVAIRPAI